jgi:hypothetical protein
MKNISRLPTFFGDFVIIHTERSMQDITVARCRVFLWPLPLQEKLSVLLCTLGSVYRYTVQFESIKVIPPDITKRESALYTAVIEHYIKCNVCTV